MKATIDKAGRLVIPKAIREMLGLTPGAVEVEVRGAGLTVTPVTEESLDAEGDLLVIPAAGVQVSDAQVRRLRDADRK